MQTALGKPNALGKISVDKIEEQLWWDEVMKELNHASFKCADELQEETGQPYTKYYTDGTPAYDLNYEESPPTRMLAMTENLLLRGKGLRRHTRKERPISINPMSTITLLSVIMCQ